MSMPLSICSDSEEEERPRSAKTSIDLSSMPWPNNIVNLEDVSRKGRHKFLRNFSLQRPAVVRRGAINWFVKNEKQISFSSLECRLVCASRHESIHPFEKRAH